MKTAIATTSTAIRINHKAQTIELTKGFYVKNRAYDLNDLRLLAECVYSSKFLSEQKARNLSHVSPITLKKNLALINARPRKVLNYRSPSDLWDFELANCCT